MSFLPIIKDLIPIIMPGAVHVTKASAIEADASAATGQTDGMVRKGAIVGKSERICASVMYAHPHTSSAIHHHGSQDTIVYAASGHGSIVSDGGKSTQELGPGDFALIPAWTEHQEVNNSDEQVTWIITRSGGVPEVVNLKGWGEGELRE